MLVSQSLWKQALGKSTWKNCCLSMGGTLSALIISAPYDSGRGTFDTVRYKYTVCSFPSIPLSFVDLNWSSTDYNSHTNRKRLNVLATSESNETDSILLRGRDLWQILWERKVLRHFWQAQLKKSNAVKTYPCHWKIDTHYPRNKRRKPDPGPFGSSSTAETVSVLKLRHFT